MNHLMRSSCVAVSLAFLLGACSTVGKPAPLQVVRADALVGQVWEALTIEGSVPLVAPKPHVKWVGVTQIAGSGGCNGFSVQAVLDHQDAHLGPLRPIGKPCMTAPSGQEDMFFRAVERTRQMGMEGEQLVFLDSRGNPVARFGKRL